MSEPLSPDRVFDFLVDEPEPHPAYNFFALGPLPGYAGNPNNNNGWIKADMPLLGELGFVANEPMVGPIEDEIAEPIVEVEEQVIAPVVDMDEDIAMLFGDDDFKDEDSEGFDEEEEVGGPSTVVAEGQCFPFPSRGHPTPLSMIEDLSTRLGNLEYGHEQLVYKVMVSQMVHAADRFEHIGTQVEHGQQTVTLGDEVITSLTQQVQALQAAVQQRDTHIQQLQTMVLEMSSREITLMRCIIGIDRRLTDMERRPSRPQ
uniref:Uncharacterized protein n=1 Tax=Tanacetum cinerariifolium TaxID=118510 RepID=A0A699J857_TANCI|nr:hypothetical protein [Tanacetum cinerariifolium]